MRTFSRLLFKYIVFTIVDIVFNVILWTSLLNDDTTGGYANFSFGEIWLMFGTPLYFALRGVCSRLTLKSIWIPNLVMFASFLLGFPIVFEQIDILEGFYIALATSLVSLLSSLITSGILRLKKNF